MMPSKIRQVVSSLTAQYKAKETEFETFKETYKITPVAWSVPLPLLALE